MIRHRKIGQLRAERPNRAAHFFDVPLSFATLPLAVSMTASAAGSRMEAEEVIAIESGNTSAGAEAALHLAEALHGPVAGLGLISAKSSKERLLW